MTAAISFLASGTTGAAMPDLTTLVLQSALLDPERALPAWTQATQLEPIDDWPNELARPLPLVYLNLKNAQQAAHLALLKGVYRAAWSANMVRLRNALDVITQLDAQSIDYRLIKGAAVCSITDNWAARRMGDIDLVIPQAQSREVTEILEAHVYEHQAPGQAIDGLWKSATGGILDLHTTTTPLLAALVKDEPQTFTELGTPLKAPSPEMSVAIAAHHAQLGHAASDHIQGLLDIYRLLALCSPVDLEQTLARTHQGEAFTRIIDQLRTIGADPDRFLQGINLEALSQSPHNKPQPQSSRSRKALRAIPARISSPIALTNKVPVLRKFPTYLAWLSAGHPRPLEARIIKRTGGFLPPPPQPLPINTQLLVSPSNTIRRNRAITSIRIPGIEDRIRIRVPQCSWARIRLSPADNVPQASRMVFVNGIMHGYFPPFDAPSVAIDLTPVKSSLEVSLRLHKHASQDDFALTVEMLKQ